MDNTEYGIYITYTEDIEYDCDKESGEYPLDTKNNSVEDIINKLEDINKETDNIINDIDETNDQEEYEKS